MTNLQQDSYEPPNYSEFNNLLAKARHFKLRGWWEGSSFRNHPCGVIRRNIILANMWNTHGYCYGSVILDPTSPIVRGMNAPASYGDPYPHPERGGELRVYWTGSWCEGEGPWKKIIYDILDDLRNEIAAAEIQAEAERMRQINDCEAARAITLQRAREALSNA